MIDRKKYVGAPAYFSTVGSGGGQGHFGERIHIHRDIVTISCVEECDRREDAYPGTSLTKEADRIWSQDAAEEVALRHVSHRQGNGRVVAQGKLMGIEWRAA